MSSTDSETKSYTATMNPDMPWADPDTQDKLRKATQERLEPHLKRFCQDLDEQGLLPSELRVEFGRDWKIRVYFVVNKK